MRRSSAGNPSLVVLAAALLLASCTEGRRATSPPTPTNGDSGVAGRSAQQLLDTASQALANADSFHVSGTTTSKDGSSLKFELTMTREGSVQGHISPQGLTVRILSHQGRLYLRGREFFARLGGSELEQRVGDRWARVPSDALRPRDSNQLDVTNPSQFARVVLERIKPVVKSGSQTLHGHPVIVLRAPTGELWVAATGTSYPLRAINTEPTGAGEIEFSRFDEPVRISEPPDAVDLSDLSP